MLEQVNLLCENVQHVVALCFEQCSVGGPICSETCKYPLLYRFPFDSTPSEINPWIKGQYGDHINIIIIPRIINLIWSKITVGKIKKIGPLYAHLSLMITLKFTFIFPV